MLRYLLTDGSIQSYIIQMLLCLPIMLLVISCHEAAHGFVAYKLGDPTARNFGRITLNPIKHIDPIGALCMVLFGIGWANPVPINTRYFKKPKRDMALSAFAGPLSNLLLALVFGLGLRISYAALANASFASERAATIAYFFMLFWFYGIQINVSFAIFNMLPIPPLDGSRVLYTFLPPKYYFAVMKYERYITIAIMLLFLLGVLTPVISFLSDIIMKGIFTLLGMRHTFFYYYL